MVKTWGMTCGRVKGQANSVIAGSPRNAFRCQRGVFSHGGRALDGLGGHKLTEPSQTPNAMTPELCSETTGDELRWSKGKRPDRRLRPQILY